MATKIKDSATAERAALKLNEGIAPEVKAGEPPAPKELTTSERLFPDFTTEDGAITNRPVRPKELSVSPPAPATVAPLVQGQTPPTQTPTTPVYLKPEELTGKMVKLKVDGIEQDVPAEELIKLKQLERHSNAQLMKISQERAQLERERQELLSRPPAPTPESKPGKPPEPIKKTPELEALEAKLAAMEQAMVAERELLRPQIQEAGIKRVEQMAKDRLGADDYRSYHEKVRNVALQEIENARTSGDPNWQRFDTDSFYFQKYQELKLKDLMAKPATQVPAPNPTAPVLQTQEGAPVVVNNSGQPVSIPTFEGSGGVPSTPSANSDWQSTYSTLLARAKQSPTDENWMAVMRHKMRPE